MLPSQHRFTLPALPLPNSSDLLLPALLSLLLFLQTCVSEFKFALALALFNQMERGLTYTLGNEMSPSLLEHLILPAQAALASPVPPTSLGTAST